MQLQFNSTFSGSQPDYLEMNPFQYTQVPISPNIEIWDNVPIPTLINPPSVPAMTPSLPPISPLPPFHKQCKISKQ